VSDLPGVPTLDTVAYIQCLARRLIVRRQPFPTDAALLRRRIDSFREVLRDLLGMAEGIDVPLNPRKVSECLVGGDVTVEKLYLDADEGWSVPALVYRPASEADGRARLPAIVVVHGWGHTKMNMNPFKLALARAGYLVIIIDNPFAGEHQTRQTDENEYQLGSMPPALALGENMMGMGVRDIRKAADYLQSRGDVDPDRLAIAGLCWGGMQAWAAVAIDDRFKVVLPVCSTSTYEALLLDYATHTRHTCLGVYLFGILKHGDFQDIAACCAPRPVLILSNLNDTWFPISGFWKLVTEVKGVYETLGAPDRFRWCLEDTIHDITPEFTERSLAWLNEHL
jgi:dienelactone hydrolase